MKAIIKTMNNINLTIFTPTYNRAYILEKLYASLCTQTSDSFEWLIVDDGSTDETEQLVNKWIIEKKIRIRYYKQENGGKQRAHNKGVELAEAPMFVCVDSDDYILPEFVRSHIQKYQEISDKSEVAGIVSLQAHSDGKPIGTYFPENVEQTTLRELYGKLHFKGDATLAYKTDILKKYPFIVEPGEKFIGESYVYNQIDQKYKMVLLPEILLIKEYLDDGYTTNVRRLTKNNPVGYMRLKYQEVEYSTNFIGRCSNTILYEVGCILAKKKLIANAPDKILAALTYPFAWIAWLIFFKNA